MKRKAASPDAHRRPRAWPSAARTATAVIATAALVLLAAAQFTTKLNECQRETGNFPYSMG